VELTLATFFCEKANDSNSGCTVSTLDGASLIGGATTISIKTITIKGEYMTLRIKDTEHDSALHNVECHYDKCCYAECHGATN
jgi:hypothetical protein